MSTAALLHDCVQQKKDAMMKYLLTDKMTTISMGGVVGSEACFILFPYRCDNVYRTHERAHRTE